MLIYTWWITVTKQTLTFLSTKITKKLQTGHPHHGSDPGSRTHVPGLWFLISGFLVPGYHDNIDAPSLWTPVPHIVRGGQQKLAPYYSTDSKVYCLGVVESVQTTTTSSMGAYY